MMKVTAKFSPGEVTPEQLEKFKQACEAADRDYSRAVVAYLRAYREMCDLEQELGRCTDVYGWAKRGMVLEPTP
jgi:hypothetical protein